MAPASLAQATSAKERKLFGDRGWGLANLGELPLAGRKESEWWSPPALFPAPASRSSRSALCPCGARTKAGTGAILNPAVSAT